MDKPNLVVSTGEQSVTAVESSVVPAMREQEWTAIIKRVAEGDQSALTEFYDSTNKLAFGLVLRVLNDRTVAEEVLLDVYMQVWRQAARYDESRGTPLSWLMTIARSRAIDRLRSGRQERQRNEPLETAGAIPTLASSPQDATVAAERQAIVRAALDTLSAEQREVIELAYYLGLSHSEIAERLGQPLGTVKTRTRLGMMKLREKLKTVYEGI
ncbi:MAG: sigma-70 family RNA polymerase sigma factor [Pyrinomonadaceae bacterium]|nr:sigma-70 family RNA polymerase sigma factor [Pyrinomonadaceae bacterium]